MLAGPFCKPPTNFGKVFLRSIYIWNAIAVFVTNSYGTYIKPTEGVSKEAYKTIKKKMPKKGGFWIWICSTKDTDIDRPKKSYIFGAVYVTGMMKSKYYKKAYNSKRLMVQYKDNSGECAYQLIIPQHKYARLELANPIEMHKYDAASRENRQAGVWKAVEGANIYDELKEARFL